MKTQLAAASILLLAACASHHDSDDLAVPQTVPPAEVQQTSAATDARLSQMQTSMTELLERIDVLNERLNKLESGSSAATQRAASDEPAPRTMMPTPQAGATQSESVRPQHAVAAPAPVPDRAVVSAQIADTYRNALMQYGRGKVDDARRTFQQVFDADPSGELADNALYWIGETYFAAGNFNEALKYYRRVTTEFSEANKAPDALFKTALTYEKLSDLGVARTTLDDVIRRYPYSSAAASAKLELKRIKY
jgi:tol-pal system protein YbgF